MFPYIVLAFTIGSNWILQCTDSDIITSMHCIDHGNDCYLGQVTSGKEKESFPKEERMWKIEQAMLCYLYLSCSWCVNYHLVSFLCWTLDIRFYSSLLSLFHFTVMLTMCWYIYVDYWMHHLSLYYIELCHHYSDQHSKEF